MRFGLYLKGGGAKGAFQAGILCAFWQRGVNYSVISGTSIGAINGWYVLHNAYKELSDLYLNLAEDYTERTFSGKVLDHSFLIDRLRQVSSAKERSIDAFYINYCKVQDGVLEEAIEDIRNAEDEAALERISWSSLLPFNHPPMNLEEFKEYLSKADAGEKFKRDVDDHVYDGLRIDGGMINNQIIRRVFDHRGERFIVIGYNGTRDEYLTDLQDLPVSDRERIIYISSDHPFDVTDTYNFSPDFLKERFQEGYNKGMDYPLVKLISS